jgi:Helix-turn-helix domain
VGFMTVLPAVHKHAKIQFRKLPAEQREEAIQETIAAAVVSFRKLAAEGMLHVARPSTLATYAVLHVRSGRHVGGHQDSASDVMSPVAHRRHDIKLASGSDDGWQSMLIASRKSDVPDLAAFRIDFENWVSSFARRDRKIIAALASGERIKTVAERFGLSHGRVSQLRRRYEHHWLLFQGEPTADANGVAA